MVTPHGLHLLQLPSSLNTATLKAKSPIYEPLVGKPYQNVHTSYKAVLAKVLLGELKDLSKDLGEIRNRARRGVKMIEDMGCEHRYQGCTGCCYTESDPPTSSRVIWEDEIPRKVRADENEDTQSSPWPTTGLGIRKILGDRQSFSSL